MTKSNFEDQTELLLRVLDTVTDNHSFALKGGTAINFFHENLPRLSVDIDLAYIKITPRDVFLKANEEFYIQKYNELKNKYKLLIQIQKTRDGIPKQLHIKSQETGIKVEINLMLRGTVYPTIMMNSCAEIAKKYGLNFRVQTLSLEDLYAGKFCAALDRQHPRDLFDVMNFFAKHDITEKLKKAFLVYLISSSRPISEMIQPHRLDQTKLFENEFKGMTTIPVTYDELTAARERLITAIDAALNQDDRAFLISFKKGTPEWGLLGIDHIKDMPAIQWKLHHIQNMPPAKRKMALEALENKLAYEQFSRHPA